MNDKHTVTCQHCGYKNTFISNASDYPKKNVFYCGGTAINPNGCGKLNAPVFAKKNKQDKT